MRYSVADARRASEALAITPESSADNDEGRDEVSDASASMIYERLSQEGRKRGRQGTGEVAN